MWADRVDDHEELQPGQRYRQTYELQAPGWLVGDKLAEWIGAGLRHFLQTFQGVEVVRWNIVELVTGRRRIVVVFEVPAVDRAAEERSAYRLQGLGALVAITPWVIRTALVGTFAVVGLTLILKTTERLRDWVEVVGIALPWAGSVGLVLGALRLVEAGKRAE